MNSISKIDLNYQLSVEDYLNGQQAASSKNIIISSLTAIVFFTTASNNLYNAISIEANTVDEIANYGISSFFGFLATFLFLDNYFPKFSPFRRWNVSRNQHYNKALCQPINLSIDRLGISFKTQGYQEFRQWQYYTGFCETKEIISIYLSQSLYYVIPKRAFNSDEQMQQLLSLFADNKILRQKK